MTRMIEDNTFRAQFETFAGKAGCGICAGTDEYGDDTTETRENIADFLAVAGTSIITDEQRDGRRFVEMARGRKTILVADYGNARLCYVG